MTAKESFFCFRIDLIHPETVAGVPGVKYSAPLWARSCLIFGARENFVADAVDASLRKSMSEDESRGCSRLLALMPSPSTLAQDLPQELLGEIFVRCLPNNAFDHLQPSSSLPPLLLCHICVSWRKAALGTPQLWNELSMQLEHISVRSHGGGLLRMRLNILEFWGSRMGALLPSLHFRRENLWRSIPREDLCKFVEFKPFFQSLVISKAQLLTLDGFSNLDALKISPFLDSISFNNLEYLAISQPLGRYHVILPKFATCPTLRGLHIDFHSPQTGISSRIVTAFSWATITHLSANLQLGRQDWHAIVAQCINMTSCSVVLVFLPEISPETNSNDRPATIHHNLRMLSVQGPTEAFTGVFDGFLFPSLVALRLSCLNPTTTRNVHQAITATPALKEFHLRFCGLLKFKITHFLHQLQGSQLDGPLRKFAPSLVILVIDRITSSLPKTTDILTLLHSNWLNDDLANLSDTKMSVEFIFDEPDHFIPDPSPVENFNREIGRCDSLPFHASARYFPDGLWNWKQLTARELRDRWDDTMAFRSV